MSDFAPRFTISNRISGGLMEIDRARGFLEAATLSDEWVRRMSQRALLVEAHATTHIEGTELTLAQAELGRFDLLLTDVIMPEVSGPELARLLTASSPDLKVLFMSGYAEDEIVSRGVVSPGVSLVPKPFTPEALALAVRNRLDDHGGARLRSG